MIAYPASVSGTLTRVLEAGSGAESVIFVHGVGARADRWRSTIEFVAAAGFHCFALDLPGHGFAKKGPDFPYSVSGYADFIGHFLDENSIGRAHFVGTSLGAHILATLTCRRPELARSLVLVGATGLFPIGEEACNAIANRVVDRSRAGIERKLRVVMYEANRVTAQMIEEEYAINNSPGSEETFAKLAVYFRTQLDADVVGERLAALGSLIPKLLIWGEEDRTVPIAIGRKAQELLRNAPLVSIPRTAHAPYAENPDEFNAILLNFFESQIS